jgi:hypothetical protein
LFVNHAKRNGLLLKAIKKMVELSFLFFGSSGFWLAALVCKK